VRSGYPRYLALAALACTAHAAVAEESPRSSRSKQPAVASTAPLDLSISDISRYVDEAELATPLPDELEEIIVNGQRLEPLPERRPIPQGALGALIYAGTHPLDAWRILMPDPNFEIPDRTEDDVKEPPGAFRARILEPGAIYD
jgi:hypothetical protein